MRNLQVLEGRGELASVVRVGVLDLPITAEELDRSAGLSFGLVLNTDASNKLRPNVLEVDCVFEPMNAMLFTFLVCNQMITSKQSTPCCRFALGRSFHVPCIVHFAFATIFTPRVKRLMTK